MIEAIYGFYHGQDPRTFTPDNESCSEAEISAYKAAVDAANAGIWQGNDSGCHIVGNKKILKSSFGVGTYYVVMDGEGNYIRDATFDDLEKEEQP